MSQYAIGITNNLVLNSTHLLQDQESSIFFSLVFVLVIVLHFI